MQWNVYKIPGNKRMGKSFFFFLKKKLQFIMYVV